MSDERRPLRPLKRFERLLVRFGRCPNCRRRLASVTHEDVASWHSYPAGIGKALNGPTGVGPGRMLMGNITQLHHRKIPHCPGCQHTFIHGWIYPVGKKEVGDSP